MDDGKTLPEPGAKIFKPKMDSELERETLSQGRAAMIALRKRKEHRRKF